MNVSPALAIFGDASTTNSQGNDNTASADVDQSNEATQAQRVEQEQRATGHGCCRDHCKRTHGCGDKRDSHKQARCCDGRNATNEQRVSGGDQTVGEQRNDSKVEQSQGNGNVNVSPAVAIFGGKDGHGCKPTCHGKKGGHGHRTGEASTRNAQGNGNDASARIGQSNEVEQRQDVSQSSALVGACKKAIGR